MALDAAAERFLKRLNALAARPEGGPSLEDLRLNLTQLTAFAAPAPEVLRTDVALATQGGEARVRIYAGRGAEAQASPGAIYFHGGGLVAGGLATHDSLCATIAEEAACKVVAVDYGLVPENRFPGPFDDALDAGSAVFRDAERLGLDKNRVAIAGDSAGAQLAIHAARALRSAKPSPVALALLCPALSVEPLTPSRAAFAKGFLLEETTLAAYWRWLRVDGLTPSDERVSPLLSEDLAGLPPTVLHVAELDPLRDEGELFAKRLREAGVAVRLRRHAGLIHHFYGLGAAIPSSRAALSAFCVDLRGALTR